MCRFSIVQTYKPPARRPRGMSAADKALKDQGINPRTNAEYKRPGGAYNTNKSGSAAASVIAQQQREGPTVTGLTKEVNSLKGQVKSLEQQVKMLTEGQELAVKNAELQARAGMSEELLAKYKEGLRDGSSLSSGKGLNSPAVPPS